MIKKIFATKNKKKIKNSRAGIKMHKDTPTGRTGK
jgi:hypothetical protein